MIVKMIQNLANRMEKLQETFNKDPEELKSKQTMMNNTINEIKNSLERINSRINEAKERISDLEDKILEITTAKQNKEKGQQPNRKTGKSSQEVGEIGRASCRERVSSPV